MIFLLFVLIPDNAYAWGPAAHLEFGRDDRQFVRFGEVVDFLDIYVGAHHWPAFNVADAAITTGAAILMAILLRRRKERPEEKR